MPGFLASYLVQVKSSQHELVLVVSGESWSGPGDRQAIPRAAESRRLLDDSLGYVVE